MRIFWCLCGRRKLLHKFVVLVLSLTVVCWVTLMAIQSNQTTDSQHSSIRPQLKSKGLGDSVEIYEGLNELHVDSQGRKPLNINEDKISLTMEASTLNASEAKTVSKQTPLSTGPVHLDLIPSQDGPDSLKLLQQNLLRRNQEQRMINSHKFPPLASDGLVLMVQVHKREGYLKQLLSSLKEARGIENVLLVISHDYYYDDMNAVVEAVDFCKVVQIFFPFSLQVLPNTFPGTSEGDCPRDATKEEAVKKMCTNALHPDSFGHYREAEVTAIKHHWWWKVNVVFDKLLATANFTGHVVFLEEDHIVAPDFIEMAQKLIDLKQHQCSDCDFINLGMYNKVKNYNGLSSKTSVGVWNAGKNNMGFGMNKQTWNLIKSCAKHFCSYDDYNWDWSLNALGLSCLQRHLKVIVLKAPRVLHIGTCGTHHHKSCNEVLQAKAAMDKINSQRSHLFPSSLILDPGTNPAAPRKKIKNYGGWGDVRDHELCLSFLKS